MSSTVALLARARERLEGAPTEMLGEVVVPRRMLGIARAPRIVPSGAAWHLGALLLTSDAVFAVGDVLRAREEVRRGYTAEAQRHRAELAAAAFRGGVPEGAVVHFDWRMLDAEAVDRGKVSGPLALVNAVPSIKWSAAGGYAPLEGYLDERIALLRTPPSGA